ncbi:hypothetical protein ACBR40_39740 [Nonomuraea sp. AD125B]
MSVDSPIVRAHQVSAGLAVGLAVTGETLDALEQALTEEGGSAPGAAAGAAGAAPQATPEAGASLPYERAAVRARCRTSVLPYERAAVRACCRTSVLPYERAATGRRRKAQAKAAALGRFRGGLSNKIHAAVDAAGLPLVFVLMPGQAADCPRFTTVLDKIRVAGPVGRLRMSAGEAVGPDRRGAWSSRRVGIPSLRRRGP